MFRGIILPVLIGIIVLGLIGFNQGVYAQVTTSDILYSCDSPNHGGAKIHELNKADGAILSSNSMVISGLPGNVKGCTGLSQDPTTGIYYAIIQYQGGGSGSRTLSIINPQTGIGAAIGSMDDGFVTLAFNSAGELFAVGGAGAGTNDELHSVDKTTGEATPLCSLPATSLLFNYLVYNWTEDVMYRLTGTGIGSGLPDDIHLDRIDDVSTCAVPTTTISGSLTGELFQSSFNTNDQLYYVIMRDTFGSGLPEYHSLTTSGVATLINATPFPLDAKGLAFDLSLGPGDTDSDGVPDNLDVCPGFDDNIDTDSDGVPDWCDSNPTAFTAVNTGDWTDGTTWEGGIVPGDSDNKTIPNGITVTNSDSILHNSGTFTNVGIINNSGFITSSSTFNGGTIYNSGTIHNTGIFNDLNFIENSGTINNFSDTINNQCGASITPGTITGNPVNEVLCIPVLDLPTDGSTETTPTPLFTWNDDVAETRSITQYEWQIETAVGVPIEIVSLSLQSHTPISLNDDDYLWNVRALDADVSGLGYPAVAVPSAFSVVFGLEITSVPSCEGVCNVIDEDTTGNQNVGPGETLTVTNGATVTGKITVDGGTLILEDSCTVDGNVIGKNGAAMSIDSCHVTGHVRTINGGTLDITNDSIVDKNVNSKDADSVTVTNNLNSFNGHLRVSGAGAVTISDNTVEKNIRVKNSGDVTISGNTVDGNIRVADSISVDVTGNVSGEVIRIRDTTGATIDSNQVDTNLRVFDNNGVSITNNHADKNINIKKNTDCTHSENTADGKIRIKDCDEVIPVNNPPTIGSVTLTQDGVEIIPSSDGNSALPVTCTANDVADIDSDSITLTYEWFDGSSNLITTGDILPASTVSIAEITCTVTPFDGTDFGILVSQSSFLVGSGGA